MTVTKDTTHLRAFKLKIDEAINCISKMHAAEKLKAVQFWNVMSEKLQLIVNSCAADINALTVKTQENESEKISSLEISSSRPLNALPNSSISSDFINLSPAYDVYSEMTESYIVDVSNAHLLTSESSLSMVRETSVKNISAGSMPFIHHVNNATDSERNMYGNNIALESLSQSSCDNLGVESCTSSDSRTHESIETNDCGSQEIPHQKSDQVCLSSESTKAICSITYQSNNLPLESSHELLIPNQKNSRTSERKKSKNYSVLRNSLMNKKSKSDSNCDNVSNVSDNSVDSVKSDFEAGFNSAESDTNPAEPIVSFVVSSTEEILAKNDLTPELVDCDGNDNHSVKSYICSDCPAKFATKGNLIVHMRRHTGEKPYTCGKCPARFTTKGNLKRHMKTHTGEKPFECTNCGGRFTEKKSLIVHMRRHTGEKPYECKECGKKFAQSGILQTHMAMHLNQKFHLCEHCGKSFRQRSQLQTHRLRHSNVRKYGCPSCSSRFLTKGDLDRHLRTHTGEKPYVCQVCSKAYTRQQSLNEHLNRHYGIRPYSCKYCSKTFAEMSACYKHIKQHEKVHGSKILSPELSIEPLNLQDSNQVEVDSNDSSCGIVKLPSCVTSKPETSELSEENDENVVTNQTLISYIENYFHKNIIE